MTKILGIFQAKRFGAHFADDWLHFDGVGWMSSILMVGEEKLRFIEFLSDHKTYKTNDGVEISIHFPDERAEISFTGQNVLMIWLKHRLQLEKFQRQLKEGLERYVIEDTDNGIFVVAHDKPSLHRFGPYSRESAEKHCKLRNFLLPMIEYDSFRDAHT